MVRKRDLSETNLQSKRISSRKYKFSDKVITERDHDRTAAKCKSYFNSLFKCYKVYVHFNIVNKL